MKLSSSKTKSKAKTIELKKFVVLLPRLRSEVIATLPRLRSEVRIELPRLRSEVIAAASKPPPQQKQYQRRLITSGLDRNDVHLPKRFKVIRKKRIVASDQVKKSKTAASVERVQSKPRGRPRKTTHSASSQQKKREEKRRRCNRGGGNVLEDTMALDDENEDIPVLTEEAPVVVPLNDGKTDSESMDADQELSEVFQQIDMSTERTSPIPEQESMEANQELPEAFEQIAMSAERTSPIPEQESMEDDEELPEAFREISMSAKRTPREPMLSTRTPPTANDQSGNFGICQVCKTDPRATNAPKPAGTGMFRLTYRPCSHHCFVCGFWDKDRLRVEEHLKREHQFRCETCGLAFGDQADAELHLMENHEQKHFCELCDRIYNSERAYNVHTNTEMHQRSLRMQNNLIEQLYGAQLLATNGAQSLVLQRERSAARRPARERYWSKALLDSFERDPARFLRAVVVHKGFEFSTTTHPPPLPALQPQVVQSEQHETPPSTVASADPPPSLQQQVVDLCLGNMSPKTRKYVDGLIGPPTNETQPNVQLVHASPTLLPDQHTSLSGLGNASFDWGRARVEEFPINSSSSIDTPRYLPQFATAADVSFSNYNFPVDLDSSFREALSTPLAFESDPLNWLNYSAQSFMPPTNMLLL